MKPANRKGNRLDLRLWENHNGRRKDFEMKRINDQEATARTALARTWRRNISAVLAAAKLATTTTSWRLSAPLRPGSGMA